MIVEITWPDEASSVVEIRDIAEHIQKHWMGRVYYEANKSGLLRWIYNNHPKGLVYVDIGASIGNHTLFFANVMQAHRVIAIEPVPTSMEHLRENVYLSDNANVVAVEAAMGDYTGDATMGRYHESNNVGMWMVGGELDQVVVPVATLDDTLAMESRVDIIKIDVEHYNAGVLHGAKKTLAERDAIIYIECENDADLREVDILLGRFGYLRTPGVRLSYTPVYEYMKE
jgi:FkbM family methyltransferase